MRIKRIKLLNFRNFQSNSFDFQEGVNLVIGGNGVGKTNLLEAISYLSIPKSFRGAKDAELIRWGETWFRIEAEIVSDSDTLHKIGISYQKSGRKRITLNGKPIKSFVELFGTFSTVVFEAGVHEFIEGPPEVRRRFIDRFISVIDFEYFNNLLEYRRILEQRNAALKAGASDSELKTWNDMLSKAANPLIRTRSHWCNEISRKLNELGRQFLDKSLSLQYQPNVEHLESELLDSNLPKERELGYTVLGPHRDDFTLMVNSRPSRAAASEGEKRLALLALVLTLRKIQAEMTGKSPVLLMDEPTNVLEPEKISRFLRHLDGQVIISLLPTHIPSISDYHLIEL